MMNFFGSNAIITILMLLATISMVVVLYKGLKIMVEEVK